MIKKTPFLFFIAALLATVGCLAQNKGKKKESNPSNPYNLPAPSESKRKNSKVIGWPEGKTPIAPEGFVVEKYAGGLKSPRWMYVTPNGDILVSESRTNTHTSPNCIILLRDSDKDGKVDFRDSFLTNLNQPLGMLVLNNWLYIGNTDGIYRYPYTPGQARIKEAGKKILDLTPGGYNNHWTR